MGKKAKKNKKDELEIPKEIAGIRLSKELRQAGSQFLKIAQDPVTREVALAAVGAALAARKERKQPGKQRAVQPEEGAGKDVGNGWLSAAIVAAAAEAGRTLVDAYAKNASGKSANGSLGANKSRDEAAQPADKAPPSGTAH